VTARLLIAATVVLSIASGLGCIDLNVIQSGAGAGGGGGAAAGVDGTADAGADQQPPDAGPPFSIGTPCSGNGDCASTYCVDGVCCDLPCDGPCAACNLRTHLGTCLLVDTISCQTSCARNSDCSSGICSNGSCCSSNQDCNSGFCSDGVCCDTSCEGACVSCNVPTHLGTCSAIDADMADPHGVCTDQGAPSCGHDGTCDGLGGCRMYLKGTPCAAPTCTSVSVTTGTCDGSGTCDVGQSISCYPYLCNPETISCQTACADRNDCSSGICTNGRCIGEPIDPCTINDQCKTGFCVNGVCCDTECNGGCGICIPKGEGGTCSAASSGTVCRAQAGACDVAETCDGTSLNCPTDTVAPVGTVCRVANGPCDVSESCDGTTKICPADGFKPTTTVCRASTGVCDAAETCSGTSAACPADAFASATTACRPAGGGCNVAETCTGTSSICPADRCGS
jgi:hypothetical protein